MKFVVGFTGGKEGSYYPEKRLGLGRFLLNGEYNLLTRTAQEEKS
jgi:hypothetical protein